MIGIGSTDIYIDTPKLTREELEQYSKHLFEQWEGYVDDHLRLDDYALSLSVEDGSLKAYGKIACISLSALYIGIGQYGSFITGIQTIKQQVDNVSDYLGQRAVLPFAEDQITPKVRKRGEALSRLESIFKKVEAGEMTIEDALEQAKTIFGEGDNSVKFYSDLKGALNDIPAHPKEEQLELDVTIGGVVDSEIKSTPKSNRAPRPLPSPSDHYRVLVWRDSKEDEVKVEVTKR